MEDKIKNWVNQNWFNFLIVVVIIFMVGGYFYWYAYRPSKIRHDCSWEKRHSNAILAITQEQYDKCLESCKNNESADKLSQFKEKYGLKLSTFPDCIFCDKPHSAQSAKNWWEPASKNQYDFCIHEKGL